MKNMGRAFRKCICTLRGAISLVFHKSWPSPACLHSGPIHSLVLLCLPLPAMIFPLPQIHAPLIMEGLEILARDPTGQGFRGLQSFCLELSLWAFLSVVFALPYAEWGVLTFFLSLHVNTEILLTSLTPFKV